jgi:cell division transport system permease protein
MRSLMRVISEIVRAIRFELLSSFGTLLTVFLAMMIPGMLWIASKNLTKTIDDLKNSLTMDVFLSGNPTAENIQTMQTDLAGLGGVRNVQYISKDDALFKIRERFGPEVIQGLDENPLPSSFELRVSDYIFEPGKSDSLIVAIRKMAGVEDVVFANKMVNRLNSIMKSIETLGLSIALIVIFSAVFIVANTVRIAITDRKKTVEMMQLVGSTRSYILAPFVSLGGIVGLLGSILAIVFLKYSVDYISKNLISLVFLELNEIVAFLLSGLLLGMLGAVVASKRYMKI